MHRSLRGFFATAVRISFGWPEARAQPRQWTLDLVETGSPTELRRLERILVDSETACPVSSGNRTIGGALILGGGLSAEAIGDHTLWHHSERYLWRVRPRSF